VELKEFITFLNKLEENSVFYKLNKIRNEAIMVDVDVPGQRWEIEFLEMVQLILKNLLVIKICTM
jgi:hypothetical protein